MAKRKRDRLHPPDWHNSWQTPKHAFKWINGFIRERYESRFGIDVAASEKNAKCERFFTKEQDALKQSWECTVKTEWAFCNPPYDDIDVFLRKAWTQSCHGVGCVVLIPAFDGTLRWTVWIENKADFVINIGGRLRFGDPDTGEENDQAKFASAFIVYEPKSYSDTFVRTTKWIIRRF